MFYDHACQQLGRQSDAHLTVQYLLRDLWFSSQSRSKLGLLVYSPLQYNSGRL
jgi:hypothetical protein